MASDCVVIAVISQKLNLEILERILLIGNKLGLSYNVESAEFKNQINKIYEELQLFPEKVYSGIGGEIAGTGGFYLEFGQSGETQFPLTENEFEIRFTGFPSLKMKQFLIEPHSKMGLQDIGWYTKMLLDITNPLPIKRLINILE